MSCVLQRRTKCPRVLSQPFASSPSRRTNREKTETEKSLPPLPPNLGSGYLLALHLARSSASLVLVIWMFSTPLTMDALLAGYRTIHWYGAPVQFWQILQWHFCRDRYVHRNAEGRIDYISLLHWRFSEKNQSVVAGNVRLVDCWSTDVLLYTTRKITHP